MANKPDQDDRMSFEIFGARFEARTRIAMVLLTVVLAIALFWYWPQIRERLQDVPGFRPSAKVVKVLIEGNQVTVGSGAQFDGWKNPGCQRHTAESCVKPQHRGTIVPGSGKPRIVSQSAETGLVDPPKETPQQYCVSFWAQTSACERAVSITAVATAVEEYAEKE
jgi:hypothetical protein